ncbi:MULTISPECIES: hypothetical protein [Serratia]|uniref:Phage-related minor tail protein n=1 Tax=Serratia quinivorans TaxID=137545 RepID=A0A379YDS7_9GAMM|nr:MULTISPECIES: hypothetical protein [Serratia]RYM55450.1 hypothetical protein BSR03_27090 [Serratia proteamaculans]CAI1715636.1 Uncharacterised protein [Serratia quinivorans]SUI43853.1 Uncharacterised protein [Serratia quinivorans]
MAGKSQKYNASINFGASVDPSMTRTLNRMTTGIDRIGTETAQVMKTQTAWQRQMKSGSASTVNQIKHMERATQALINKQEALEKEIRDGVKSGHAGMAFLVEDYKKVGVGIERARKGLERLNAQQERETKLAHKQQQSEARRGRYKDAFLSSPRNAWAKTKAVPGNMMASGLRMAGGLPFAAARAAIMAPVALAGAGAALGGGVLALNRKTAEEYRRAKQYGMSYRHYKAGSIMAEQAGLNGENYGDLTEELSNKLGEEGNDKTVNPMLAMIGLNKHLMKGTKQQQFDKVMQTISEKVKSGKLTAQQGESLADQLMGGEANKLMTYIISTRLTYKEVMKNASELNNITEDEARAALETSQMLSNMWTSAETALAGVAGDIGYALRPQLKEWEGQFETWVKNNKAMITNTIVDWVDGGGPKRVVDSLENFGRVVSAVSNMIGWFLPDNSDEARQRRVLQELAQKGSMALAQETAHNEGLDDWFKKNVKGNKELQTKLINTYVASKGFFYDDNEGFENRLDYYRNTLNGEKADNQPMSDGEVVPVFSRLGNANVNNTHNNQYHFNIVIDGGASEAGAQALYDKFKTLTGDTGGSSDTFDSANIMAP